jgi:exonuclease SbcC
MKIAHLADIHIQGKERINENRIIFENLAKSLKITKPDYIVLAGDIFHTKTENITPESISLLVDFFNSLGSIAETHIILGNHDGNLKNDQREDAITPIIKAINNPNIFLHKKTETYTKGDYKFFFFSLFDKEGWRSIESPSIDKINISVFHGSVLGCVYENGVIVNDPTHAEVDIGFFKSFDYSMLGDIHKRQDMDKAGRVHYPGSLSQLDHGESIEKGYTLWNINSKSDFSKDFIKVTNPFLFLTTTFTTLDETQKSTLELVQLHKVFPGWKLKIKSTIKISDSDKVSLKTYAMTKLGAKDVDFDEKIILSIDSLDIQGEKVSKQEIKTSKEKIKELYEKFISRNKENYKSLDLKSAKNIIDSHIENLSGLSDQVRDAVIKLETYEFDNVLSYGKENKLNFSKLSGLVGIHGKNRVGKSSLIGSLALTLYNVTDRAPVKSAFVVNNMEKDASMRMLFSVSGQKYLLERKIEKQIQKTKNKKLEAEDKAATSLKLFKLDRNGAQFELKNENAISRTDTEKVLRNIIGTPEDFLFTSLSAQGQINSFINSGATSRKELLNRFLDLDIFKQLYSSVNEEYNLLKKGELKSYDKLLLEEEISKASILLEEMMALKQTIELEIELISAELESLPDIKEYNLLHQQLNTTASKLERKTNEYNQELKIVDSLKLLIETKKQKLNLLKQQLLDKNTNIDLFNKELNVLETEHKELLKLKEVYNSLNKEVETNKKIVRKLSLVPCGDEYQTCVYIKDAHESKKTLDELNKKLIELSFDEENINSKIELFDSIKQLLQNENAEKIALDKEISDIENKLYRLTVQLTSKQDGLIPTLIKDIQEYTLQKEELVKKCELLFSLSGIQELKDEKLLVKKQKMQQLNNCVMEIGKNENIVKNLSSSKETKEAAYTKMKQLESILEAFSKNGIPAMLLNSQLPIINNLVNHYLNGAVDFKLKFETEVGVNTLDIFIEDAKSKRVIELASGMEKMVSSLAIRAALMELTPLPKLDSLIIDEGFDALDQNNLSNVVKILFKLKDKFKTIFVITHIPTLKEYMDEIIEINQEPKTMQSYVRYN